VKAHSDTNTLVAEPRQCIISFEAKKKLRDRDRNDVHEKRGTDPNQGENDRQVKEGWLSGPKKDSNQTLHDEALERSSLRYRPPHEETPSG